MLAKDAESLHKELVGISSKIKEAYRELGEVNRKRKEEEDRLSFLLNNEQKNIDLLENKISELSIERDRVISQTEEFNKKLLDIKLNIEKENVKMSNMLDANKLKELSLVNIIKDLSYSITKLETKKEILSMDIKSLEEKKDKCDKEKEDISIIIKQKEELVNSINYLLKQKEYLEKQFEDLNNYKEELDKRDKELTKDANEIYIMQQRIKPKYVKIFGKYSNI